MEIPYYSQQLGKEGSITYGTDGAAGIDLPYYDSNRHYDLYHLPKWKRWFAERKLILPFVRYKLPTGIHMAIPEGHYGQIDSRSSTSKKKMFPLCRTIDSDYRGNIHVVFMMLSLLPRFIKVGETRFQIVVQPYVRAKLGRVDHRGDLGKTVRGDQGFGSTDNKEVK